MLLTWKDLITTGLAVAIAAFSYLFVNGYHFPLLTGFRSATLVLLLLGIGMCALSSTGTPNYRNPWITTASILGVLSLILIVVSLIIGTKVMFIAVAATILVLWAVATFRHFIGG